MPTLATARRSGVTSGPGSSFESNEIAAQTLLDHFPATPSVDRDALAVALPDAWKAMTTKQEEYRGRGTSPLAGRAAVIGDGDARVLRWLDGHFGNSLDGLLISRSGRVVYANDRLHRLLQAPDGALAGRPAFEIYPESEFMNVMNQIQSMAFFGEPHAPVQLPLLRLDGALVPVEVSRLLIRIGREPWLVEIVRVEHDGEAS